MDLVGSGRAGVALRETASEMNNDSGWYRSHGLSWRVIGAQVDERVPPPDDLIANIDFAVRVAAKIATLTTALQEAMEATAVAAERWRVAGAHPVDMEQFYRDFQKHLVPGRSTLKRVLTPHSKSFHPAPENGTPVVYVLIRDGVIVYVGRTINAKARVSSHRSSKSFDSVQVYVCASVDAAADLEAILIEQHDPQYNKRIEPRNGTAA